MQSRRKLSTVLLQITSAQPYLLQWHQQHGHQWGVNEGLRVQHPVILHHVCQPLSLNNLLCNAVPLASGVKPPHLHSTHSMPIIKLSQLASNARNSAALLTRGDAQNSCTSMLPF
jgi:hypothetical protein